MNYSDSEAIHIFFNRIRPIYHQLFNLAHAITGNCDRAEYCLQCAMLECWTAGDVSASRHGFREKLRRSIIRASLKAAAKEPAETSWNGLRFGEDSGSAARLISQEPIEMQRILALRYGCGLNLRRIAQLVQADTARVRQVLHRFEARTKRRLSPGERRKWELLVSREIQSCMNQPCALAPEAGSVLRTFQSDAATVTRSSHLPAYILRIVVAVVLGLMCMVTFWFAAVLIQPTVLEEPGNASRITETAE